MAFVSRFFVVWVAVFLILGQAVQAAVVNATWNSATDTPVTGSGYTATGDTISFTLNFAPPTGTTLTVVNNTGLSFISGRFDNLAQGQPVTLVYQGTGYNYVANYHGGTGNDLVLVWVGNRALSWGYHLNGVLGDGSISNRLVPGPVTASGVLAGKVIIALAGGSSHGLALCSDGTVASWGGNWYGQLGDGTTASKSLPVAVNAASGSALHGKTVVAIAAGFEWSMALCSDGTMVSWGYNSVGQLGDGTETNRTVPVAVSTSPGTSALFGKSVVGMAAGSSHTLALCSDGTVVAWGSNSTSQLGAAGFPYSYSTRPVAVSTASGVSALHGKTPQQVAAGVGFSVVLCTDGSLASWGANTYGQLGDNTLTNRSVPGPVNAVSGTSALHGRTPASVVAGSTHVLTLCTDGNVVAWGLNASGQLGDNSTTNRPAAVVVNRASATSALFGKTVRTLATASSTSAAFCADGTLATWGTNAQGQLGNNGTTASSVPVAVGTSTLAAGEKFASVSSGIFSAAMFATAAGPAVPPTATTLPATAISTTGVTLNGVVNANNTWAAVSFDYGTTISYGLSAEGTPPIVTQGTPTAVSAVLTNLTPGALYHFRVRAGGSVGTDFTFTAPSNVVDLAGLTAGSGTLSPAFSSSTASYTLSVPESTDSLSLTATAVDPLTTVRVNGVVVASGSASGPVRLGYGTSVIPIVVTAQDGVTARTYMVTVTRPVATTPGMLSATYDFASYLPVSAGGFTATGWTVDLSLNFAPPVGTRLTVVNNTGPGLIGRFGNLAHGQPVSLAYNGVAYAFVANYYGGTGNDLVLEWAATRPIAWGNNNEGQLADNRTLYPKKTIPSALNTAGTLLAGRQILTFAGGYSHTLALCTDGTLAAWGYNGPGQLGNGSNTDSSVPVAVTRNNTPLEGKTVVALAGGSNFSLALCSDGTLASWGRNVDNELGNGNATGRNLPGAVVTDGTVLAGKSVTTITAGFFHGVVLCSDGTLAAWGDNERSQLGNGTTTDRSAPVAVTTAGTPLAGRTVSAIATGAYHTLVLCTDGTLVTWGSNNFGQLGNGGSSDSSLPVAVTVAGTPLAGKTPVAVAAGGLYNLVLCSDGSLISWGGGLNGQLGNGTTANSSLPVAVTTYGVLAGKTVTALRPGGQFCMVQCSDGTLVSWGYGNEGCLGVGSFTTHPTPVQVNSAVLSQGEKFLSIFAGPQAWHVLGLVAVPAPTVTTQAATSVGTTTAVLNGLVNPNGPASSISFDYGLDTTYGSTVGATPATASGTSATGVSAPLSGLAANTTYHYRVSAAGAGGASYPGADGTFTTLDGTLSSLALSVGTLAPAFSPAVYSYSASVGSEVTSITLTPALSDSNASLTVNGAALASGGTSQAIPLVYGDNTIRIVVTAADLSSTLTHTVVVRRAAPAVVTASYASATTVPLTSHGLIAAGGSVDLSLGYAPSTGTTLTVVNNTGPGFIQGQFVNLEQGQWVELVYNGGTYTFVANYYGGTGNDLVLVWGGTRVVAWGSNTYGALGNPGNGSMVRVNGSGTALAYIPLLKLASGAGHSLALCADNTLMAWGRNEYGQLGNIGNIDTITPVAVPKAGTVLAGKRIIDIAAGETHSLALCSDGTLAAWGRNTQRQLGNNTTTHSNVPVAVTIAGTPLAGKTVVAIGAGASHCMVLCSDGTLFTWGGGPLGTGASSSGLPVAVTTAGTPLAGRTVVSMAVGASHNVVACSDGTLLTWGGNNFGQLGNNTLTDSLLPTAVATAGTVVAGKTIASLASGAYHNLVLCTDGTLAAWGFNSEGALGNGTIVLGRVPGPVTTSGVLAGRTIVAVSAGGYFSQARCADGTVAAWGGNSSRQLGNGSTSNSLVPVLVDTSSLGSGERLISVHPGPLSGHSLGIVATPAAPSAVTLPASQVATSTAVLNGTVNASGSSTATSFEYGLSTSYGQTVDTMQGHLHGDAPVPVSAPLRGLLPNTTYHYRVIGANSTGTTRGADQTFTTLNGVLSALTPGLGALSPAFSPAVFNYQVTVGFTDSSIAFTPVAADSQSTITINGAAVASGSASSGLPLTPGDNVFNIVVTPAGSTSTLTYIVVVTRPLPAAWAVAYATGGEVPVTTAGVTGAGGTVDLSLHYAPQPGTTLTVMNNVGRGLINSRFSNLAHGQRVTLRHNGVDYPFIANYYGGTGNDLVLAWAWTRPMAWGWNAHGQLGNGSTVDSTEFVPVTTAGTSLAGRPVMALASASYHSLALGYDGSLHTWGAGAGGYQSAKVPVPVTTAGTVLAGKTVVSLGTANWSSYALCSDGTIAIWERVGSQPSALPTAGTALAGKTVVAIATSLWGPHLALCSDGSLVTWGDYSGSIGLVPVAGTPLEGRSVVSIAVGGSHYLALCSDGTLAAWGGNNHGQLGNGMSSSLAGSPTAVRTAGTALEGRTVTAVTAGYEYSAALCSDGTLVAWGRNTDNALGVTPPAGLSSEFPSEVNRVGALAGRTVVGLTSSSYTLQARCSDGSVVYWGLPGVPPAEISSSALSAGERVTSVFVGSSDGNLMGLASSLPPAAATLAAAPVGTTTAVLQGTVNAHGTPFPAAVFFDYGLDTSYGRTAAATPASATGSSPVAVSAALGGLQSNTTYHYRVRVVGGPLDVLGADQTFTTLNGNLSGLALGAGAGVGVLTPAFSPTVYNYRVDVDAGVSSVVLTPTVSDSQATVAINGVAVASGSASSPVPLPLPGENTLHVVVTASDHLSTITYNVVVTRPVPGEWAAAFAAATDVPLTTPGFTATGGTVNLALNYAPVPGTSLMVVKNTGLAFINGQLNNLAHGQRVELVYNGVTYAFVANYHGGTGNDLVLAWAGTRTSGWGNSSSGQLTYNNRNLLAGSPFATRVPLAAAAGGGHSLAVFADGSVAGWGANTSGQLGRGTTNNSYDPAAVSTAGTALAGKVVVAVAAGSLHSLALCSDGTLAAWGDNFYGQLGNGTTNGSSLPVAVTTAGTPLEGKFVVAISAGIYHNLALCSDGTLVAWGSNDVARLGNWNVGYISTRPVAVMTEDTALEGRTVVAIAAGNQHNLVLCSDGTLATWGFNWQGQLGMGTISTTSVYQAVAVTTVGTVLEGRTVTAIAAGGNHSLVLCSDGTVAAWGSGSAGVLGNNTETTSGLPVAVDRAGVLAGRTVVGITAGSAHSTAWCADGTATAWGSNFYGGQLGNPNAGNASSVPVLVTAPRFWGEENFKVVVSGPAAHHTLALVATVPPDGSPPSSNANLSSLTVSVGALDPVFHGDNPYYSVVLDAGTHSSITFTPTAQESQAGVAVGTQMLPSGTPSDAIPLTPGLGGNLVNITTIAPDGVTGKIYQVWVWILTPAEKWRWHMNGWRNEHGFFVNSGNMADTGDYDRDGISNLMEYALRLNPKQAGSLPAASALNGANFEYTYTRSTAAANTGTVFTVQWATSLAGASWSSNGVTETVLSDDGTTQQVKAVIPKGAAAAMYVRLAVGGPPP